MIFPIGDDNSDRTITPYVNYILIIINILFSFFAKHGNDLHFTYAYSTVPQEIVTGHDVVTTGQIITDPLRAINLDYRV